MPIKNTVLEKSMSPLYNTGFLSNILSLKPNTRLKNPSAQIQNMRAS